MRVSHGWGKLPTQICVYFNFFWGGPTWKKMQVAQVLLTEILGYFLNHISVVGVEVRLWKVNPSSYHCLVKDHLIMKYHHTSYISLISIRLKEILRGKASSEGGLANLLYVAGISTMPPLPHFRPHSHKWTKPA